MNKEIVMPTGKLKWYDNLKGVGCILRDDDSREILVHASQREKIGYARLKAAKTITFDIDTNIDWKIEAINLRLP